MQRDVRVGTDIGGTFTDLIAVHDDGDVVTNKVLSVPTDQSLGFAEVIRGAIAQPESIVDVVHGTTVAINSLLERKTAQAGMLCTRGHRDVLEVRRMWREPLFGNWWKRPESLIPRRLRLEVPERIDARGQIVEPLDEGAVREAAQVLWDLGVRSIAIAFINSYVNAVHERRAAEVIRESLPDAVVTTSSEVLPEIREYERTSTTAIASMLRPTMMHYVSRLERRLDDLAASQAPVRIMRSNGGLMTTAAVASNAVSTLMSGPAGGVTACVEIGRAMGAPNVITFDMGGTSTDVALIDDHRPLETMERDIEWNIVVRNQMLDIRSIGAGGGSLGWIDAAGALRVGPQSAGADPGPACYGNGGTAATVTDANVVLGRIDPKFFLGGEMELDADAGRAAVERLHVRDDWQAVDTAYAIYRISLGNMALLLREMSINRGYDPRDFLLMSFGGAGGLAAADLARELKIPRVCVPRNASVLSALGGLLGDIVYDYASTFLARTETADISSLDALCQQLLERGRRQIEEDGLGGDHRFEFALDVRYFGGAYDLTIPLLRNGAVRAEDLTAARDAFEQRHRQLYAFDRPNDPVEISALRLRTISSRRKPRIQEWRQGGAVADAVRSERSIYFQERGFVTCTAYLRDALAAFSEVDGPCVIEERDTVTVIHPGQRAEIDAWGSIIVHA